MNKRGFTLIEILVVLAIIATLLSLVTPRYFIALERSKEKTLRHDLGMMREAIDKYYGDKDAYPSSLDELVQHKYLRAIPPDPITDSTETWIISPPPSLEDKGQVYDVHSGAKGNSLNGSPYAIW